MLKILKEKNINAQNLGLIVFDDELFSSLEIWEKKKIHSLCAIFAMITLLSKKFDINHYLYTDLFKKWNSGILVKEDKIFFDNELTKHKQDKYKESDFNNLSSIKIKEVDIFRQKDLDNIINDLKSLYYILNQEHVESN